MGQKIKTLVDNVESAGVKIISWDGKDASGNTVSSGIYIFRMKSDKFIKSKRMLMSQAMSSIRKCGKSQLRILTVSGLNRLKH